MTALFFIFLILELSFKYAWVLLIYMRNNRYLRM